MWAQIVDELPRFFSHYNLIVFAKALGVTTLIGFVDLQSTPPLLALMLGQPAEDYLDSQRATHLQRMRELTEVRRTADVVDALLADHALFHLEADLRWIDLTSARLGALAETVKR